jgi:hypothetical protein
MISIMMKEEEEEEGLKKKDIFYVIELRDLLKVYRPFVFVPFLFF